MTCSEKTCIVCRRCEKCVREDGDNILMTFTDPSGRRQPMLMCRLCVNAMDTITGVYKDVREIHNARHVQLAKRRVYEAGFDWMFPGVVD